MKTKIASISMSAWFYPPIYRDRVILLALCAGFNAFRYVLSLIARTVYTYTVGNDSLLLSSKSVEQFYSYCLELQINVMFNKQNFVITASNIRSQGYQHVNV
jgi:hypothetical protein